MLLAGDIITDYEAVIDGMEAICVDEASRIIIKVHTSICNAVVSKDAVVFSCVGSYNFFPVMAILSFLLELLSVKLVLMIIRFVTKGVSDTTFIFNMITAAINETLK